MKKEQISQDELHEFFALEKRFVDVRARYEAVKVNLTERIRQGASQEPGRYRLEPSERWIRRLSWKSVVIELRSERFAESCLNSMRAKKSTVLRWAELPSVRGGK